MSIAKALFKAKPQGPVRESPKQIVITTSKNYNQIGQQESKNNPTEALQKQQVKSSVQSTQKLKNEQANILKSDSKGPQSISKTIENKQKQRVAQKIGELLFQKTKPDKKGQKEKPTKIRQPVRQQKIQAKEQQRKETDHQQIAEGKNLKTGKHFKIFNPKHFQIENKIIKTSIHRWDYGTGQTPDDLLISSWNLNGIRARMKASNVQPYVKNRKPDIFCVNEHKMDEKSYNQNPIEFWGYHSYWNFPKYSLGYSGVAIFSKYPALRMIQDVLDPEHSRQGRVITLQFQKFYIVQCYIPTVGRQLQRLHYRVEQYDPAFRNFIVDLQRQSSKPIIICGDMNVSHHQIDCHTGYRMKQMKQASYTIGERNSFSTLLKTCSLVDSFRELHPNERAYTWWNMRISGKKRAGETGIGKRLDYFLVSKEFLEKNVISSEIKKDWNGCDHCPIQLQVNLSSLNAESQKQ